MAMSMFRRQLLRTTVGLASASLWPSLARAANIPREVLTFYYAWYGDPNNHPDWRGIDLQARRTSNAPHYPTAGPYSSRDIATLRRHMHEMRSAGITGLIYSWWGRDSYEDKNLPLVLEVARQEGIKCSLYYEKCPLGPDRKPKGDLVQKELLYILDRYASSSNWLKVDKEPVIFIYTKALEQLPAPSWKIIIGNIKNDFSQGVFFNGAALRGYNLSIFDAIHRYALVADVRVRPPEQISAWAEQFYPRFLNQQRDYRIKTMTVYPGYNDTLLKRRRTMDTGRFEGRLYEALWKAALKYEADWMLITSWNEWHEGSEIEPSDQHGDTYLRLTKKFSDQFLSSRM